MKSFIKPDRRPDFEDCFSGRNAYSNKTAKELAQIAIASSPAWFRFAFYVRQKLAKLVGLTTKVSGEKDPDVSFLLSLPVLQEDAAAYEAGLSDKHLDFTLRISKNADEVSLQTQIWYNNFWGRIYLMIVKPFHNLIVEHWIKQLGKPT